MQITPLMLIYQADDADNRYVVRLNPINDGFLAEVDHPTGVVVENIRLAGDDTDAAVRDAIAEADRRVERRPTDPSSYRR